MEKKLLTLREATGPEWDTYSLGKRIKCGKDFSKEVALRIHKGVRSAGKNSSNSMTYWFRSKK